MLSPAWVWPSVNPSETGMCGIHSLSWTIPRKSLLLPPRWVGGRAGFHTGLCFEEGGGGRSKVWGVNPIAIFSVTQGRGQSSLLFFCPTAIIPFSHTWGEKCWNMCVLKLPDMAIRDEGEGKGEVMTLCIVIHTCM